MKGIVRVGFGMKRATMRKAGTALSPVMNDVRDEKELQRELKKLLRPDPVVKKLLRRLDKMRRPARQRVQP